MNRNEAIKIIQDIASKPEKQDSFGTNSIYDVDVNGYSCKKCYAFSTDKEDIDHTLDCEVGKVIEWLKKSKIINVEDPEEY